MTMLAYHNDPAIKAKLLADLQAHADADQLVKGQYWQNGKGCAVGCTLHSLGAVNTSSHAAYEKLLGIPQALARLEDRLFEGLPNADAMRWPMRFSAAIVPGADLSRVVWKFLHWLLTDGLPPVDDAAVTAAIKQCADVLVPLTRGEPVDRAAARAAAYAARAAANAAAAAAAYAAARAAADAAPAAASGEEYSYLLLALILKELRSIRARMNADAACGFMPMSENPNYAPCNCRQSQDFPSMVCPRDCPARQPDRVYTVTP